MKEKRDKVKQAHPTYSVGDVAKFLSRHWDRLTNDISQFQALASKDKARCAHV